jgi:hypothetical protein
VCSSFVAVWVVVGSGIAGNEIVGTGVGGDCENRLVRISIGISPNILSVIGDIGGGAMRGICVSDSPRIGDSMTSSSNGELSVFSVFSGFSIIGDVGIVIIVDLAVVISEGAEEIVDKTRFDDGVAEIEIGIFNPRPVGVGVLIMVALDRSASATFSAVNVGTAGIGVGFPKVMILGCARTATGTGAAAIIAVDRYALGPTDPRVYIVPTESREYVVSRLLLEYIVSRSE